MPATVFSSRELPGLGCSSPQGLQGSSTDPDGRDELHSRSQARSHDELAAHGSVLHCLVSLDDLLEAKHVGDGNLEPACFYILNEALKDRRREVRGVSAVRGQPNASWDVVDRIELLNRPLVGKYPGEAGNAVDADAAQRVGEGG